MNDLLLASMDTGSHCQWTIRFCGCSKDAQFRGWRKISELRTVAVTGIQTLKPETKIEATPSSLPRSVGLLLGEQRAKRLGKVWGVKRLKESGR
jgi:hypothetical protein